MWAGTLYSASVRATKQARKPSARGEPSLKLWESARRSADQASEPMAMNAFNRGAVQATAASAARPENKPVSATAARSTIRSPMATPPRKGSSLPARRNTPEGQILNREITVRVVGRFDPTYQLGIMGFVQWDHWYRVSLSIPSNSASCNQAACLGAFLVLDHSSIIAHLTSSSLAFIFGVPVRTVSSSRWPLGSKK